VTTTASRVLRLVGTGVLAAVPVWTAPTSAAVSPPPVDYSLLPKPASPSPPQRTEQLGECVAVATPVETGGGQLAEFGLGQVWPLTRGAGQTVAVIDTGVSRHRLLPRLIPGGDYVSTGDGTEDCDGHGTIVAGIIGAAADEPSTFRGVAPEATVIAMRQSSNRFRAVDDPGSSGFGDVETLAMAVRAAADMGATVINVSTVACVPANDVLDDRALGAALAYAVDVKNVVVVAAAGNVGGPGQCPEQNPAADPVRPGRPNWTDVKVVVSPAWYDDYVLTVGSVGTDGAPSQFSLAGPWVDVAAAGEDVVSLDPDGEGLIDTLPSPDDELPIAGTSYAAPVVSGVVALVRSRFPELTARQVMQRIEDTTRRPAANWDPVVGHGVVDPVAAVSGGPARAAADDDTMRTLSIPTTAAPGEDQPTRVAVRGAAVCLVVTAVIVAMTASAARLRRRSEAIAHD
jgi:membrane-anchored mycosin MYCP